MEVDTQSWSERISRLEEEELRDQDNTNESVFKSLLILYLLNDESMKGKLLWQRMPATLKKSAVENQTELFHLWSLIQLFIERKYSQAFAFAHQQLKGYQWSSEELGNLVKQMMQTVQGRLFDLLNLAYSSISVKEVASLLGYVSTDEALKAGLAHNWSLDDTKEFLIPVKKQNTDIIEMQNQARMQQLTGLVSFLEA